MKKCPTCIGSGLGPKACLHCDGLGVHTCACGDRHHLCGYCGGQGTSPCPHCGGKGYFRAARRNFVAGEIPAQVQGKPKKTLTRTITMDTLRSTAGIDPKLKGKS